MDRMVNYLTADLRATTRRSYESALRRVYRFNARNRIIQWTDWTSETAIAFIDHLMADGLESISVASIANRTFRLVSTLQVLEPQSVHPDFYVPSAYIPKIPFEFRQDNGLRSDVVTAILHACFLEIEKIQTASTLRNLVPFAVALAMRTGINAGSLYSLKRNCLIPASDAFDLVWDKPRAGGELRQRHRVVQFGVVEIVQKLQGMTEGDSLFSLPNGKGGWRRLDRLEPALSEFINDYGFPPFTLADLRPAMATWIFERTGAITRVQRFLGHRSADMTLRYLHQWSVRPQQAEAIRTAHATMCNRWGFPQTGDRP